MATLAEKLDALAVLDSLQRTENPLATANWEKLGGAKNIGQVTATGWTTTTAKELAGAIWKGSLPAVAEFAVLFTVPVLPAENEEIVALGFTLGTTKIDTFLFRESATTFYCSLEIAGVGKAEAPGTTWAAGDRFAVVYYEGKARFMRKPSAGVWAEVLSFTQAISGTSSVPYIEFAPGAKASTAARLTNFAAGSLVSSAPATLPLAPATGAAATALALHAPTSIALGAANGAAATALALHAPTRLPLAPAVGAAATALVLSTPSKAVLPLAPAVGAAATGLALRAPPRLSLAAVGAASTGLTLSVPAKTLTRVVINLEHPPSKIAAIVKAADGTKIARWAEDESRIENVLGNASKTGDMPGGHGESGQALARDPNESYPDLALFAGLEWQGAGGEVLWSGGIRQEPQDTDRNSIEVKAVGDKQFLEDDEEVVGPGFISGDMTKFDDPSTARRALEAVKSWHFNSNAQSQLIPAGGTEASPTPAAIAQIWSQVQSDGAAELDVAESWFDGGGVELGEVLLDFLPVKNMGGAWRQLIYSSADDIGAAVAEVHNFGSSPATMARYQLAVGQFFLLLQTYFAGAFTGEAVGGWEVQWRNIKILGRLGLTLQGTWPNVGFTAKQMLPFIAQLAGLTTKDELLEDDEFVIPHAWFDAPGTPMSKLVEVTKYGLLDWFVFEHQLLQYRFPQSYGRKWRLSPGSGAPKNSGPDANRVWDGLMVTWQDTDGTTKKAGRIGSGAMYEDPRLEITDPRNAAVATGRPRRKLLALGGTCEAGPAIRTGQRFLEEAANLDQSGEATISGYCQDSYGIWWPAAYVQPGDWAADPGTQNYRKVTSVGYSHDSKTASVSLGAPPDGLSALESRFNARLIELGLGS